MFEIPATNEPSLRGSHQDDHAAKRSCCEQCSRDSVSVHIPQLKAAAPGSSVIPGDTPSAVYTYVKELQKILVMYNKKHIRVAKYKKLCSFSTITFKYKKK